MAEVVWKLFCNSTAQSTRRTYSVGIRHLDRFMSSCNTPPIIHYIPLQLSLNGITLCFFTAYLYRLPTINSAKTIENYSGQVKSSWAKAGLLLTEFDEAVRKDIIKGVRRILPSKPDTRPAFLLPHYFLHPIFIKPRSSTQLLLKAASILGFLGSIFNL